MVRLDLGRWEKEGVQRKWCRIGGPESEREGSRGQTIKSTQRSIFTCQRLLQRHRLRRDRDCKPYDGGKGGEMHRACNVRNPPKKY